MKLKLIALFLIFSFYAIKVQAQPCKLLATLTSSNISITPKDPDFRDKCNVEVKVKNPGTCGWEKGKVKLNWKLSSHPPKARSFPRELLSGTRDVKSVVLPGKEGTFADIDFPWPEYNGMYEVTFWISYNGSKLSKDVKVEINWD